MKTRFLTWLSRFVLSYPKAILFVSCLLALASILHASFTLKFDSDQDNLVSEKLEYHKLYKKYLAEFDDQEYIYVVFDVNKNNRSVAKQALVELAHAIGDRPDLYKTIRYQQDVTVFKNRFFLLLDDSTFEQTVGEIKNWRASIQKLLLMKSYADLFDLVSDLMGDDNASLKKNQKQLELGFATLENILGRLTKPQDPKPITGTDLLDQLFPAQGQVDSQGFYFSEKGNLLFLFVLPVKDYTTSKVIAKPLIFLRQQISKLQKKYPDLTIGVTGRPVLQFDEMQTSGEGTIWASLISLFGISLLFMLFFKQARRPLYAVLCLVGGISWTLGFVTLALGKLNLLNITFGAILLGLGIEFGIHFLFRYMQERVGGKSTNEAIIQTILSTTGAIFTGAITASVAFFSALFTDFLGLKELGLVAGVGVLLCLISQIVTLPALLVVADQKNQVAPLPKWDSSLEQIVRLRRPLILGVIVLCGLSLWMIPKMRFENNLLKLQNPNLGSVITEEKIIRESNTSTWFAVFLTRSLDELQHLTKKIANLDTVGHQSSILDIVRPDQQTRKQTLANLHFLWPQNGIPKSDLAQFGTSLHRLEQSLETLQNRAFAAGNVDAVKELEKLLEHAATIRQIATTNPPEMTERLKHSEKNFFGAFGELTDFLRQNLSPTLLQTTDLPEDIKNHFLSPRGNYALYVYPEDDIWEENFLAKFVHSLKQVDPHVVGPPIEVYESSLRMKQGFYWVGWLTLVFVVLILLIDFKNIRDALLSLAPVGMGLIWLCGLMGWLKIDLSLANFFGLPILIGIGIDHGVHLVHNFKENRSIKKTFNLVAPSITLASLTTCVGFGAVAIVPHPGLASFGYIMALGSLTTLLAALVVVPLVLKKYV